MCDYLTGTAFVVDYTMDDAIRKSPAQAWKEMGSPATPCRSQLKYIRSFEARFNKQSIKQSLNQVFI